MERITIAATLENLAMVREFIEGELEKIDCPIKSMMGVSIAVEEIYVNIARYAYSPTIGEATIQCRVNKSPKQIMIQFVDSGKPFDPLIQQDVDITLSAEEREIGGLGILMAKKCMDFIEYKYENGKNILTIWKYL